MFDLVYKCKNCNHTVSANTVDGRVCPPPELCFNCVSLMNTESSGPRRKREPGAVLKGLQLDYYNKSTQEWRVLCLFCMDYKVVKNNNIGVQLSCGCLKSNPLRVNYFDPENTKVNCTCKACGLVSDYILGDGPVVCKSGCI